MMPAFYFFDLVEKPMEEEILPEPIMYPCRLCETVVTNAYGEKIVKKAMKKFVPRIGQEEIIICTECGVMLRRDIKEETHK